MLDLHTLAELQVFTAPHPQTAMMLLRPQVCTVEGSALIYVIARPLQTRSEEHGYIDYYWGRLREARRAAAASER